MAPDTLLDTLVVLAPDLLAYDISVYFEANGHGTLLFSDRATAALELVRDNTTDFKLVYIDILEFQGRNIKPINEALYVRFAADSRKLLAHHPEEGVLRPVHPAVFTRSIIALFLHFYLESVMLQISLSEDIGLSEDEIADQMADLLLHGIIVREP